MRSFAEATFRPDPVAVTALVGPNGSGKTTVLEAVAFLGSHRSFRTTTRDSMVQTGAPQAMLRGRFTREGRPLTVESELIPGCRPRTLVNHRPVTSRTALAEAVPATVFSPDDLSLVQGPPGARRELLDAGLRLLDRAAGARLDALERVLRQRTALLRQAGGRLAPDVVTTLDVWDARLAEAGHEVLADRTGLLASLVPVVAQAYADLAGDPGPSVTLAYRPSWDGALGEALGAHRREDVRRAVTSVGPHRDDVAASLDGRDARTQASQGEQRSLALALRLAVHRVVSERSGRAPVLLLDDVFSELDPDRSRALVRHLPPGQALLTTAAPLPEGLDIARVVDVRALNGSR